MPFYDQASETAPRERLRALQFQKLQKLLHDIFGRNQFYTRKWNNAELFAPGIQSFSDFQKLPFPYKSDFVSSQEKLPPFEANGTFSVEASHGIDQNPEIL